MSPAFPSSLALCPPAHLHSKDPFTPPEVSSLIRPGVTYIRKLAEQLLQQGLAGCWNKLTLGEQSPPRVENVGWRKSRGFCPKDILPPSPTACDWMLDLLLILLGLFVPAQETEIPERKGGPAGTLGLLPCILLG